MNSKAVVQTYFDVILGKNTEVALPDLFTDDATWRVPHSNPMIKPKAEILIASISETRKNIGLAFYAVGIIAIGGKEVGSAALEDKGVIFPIL